MTKGWQAEGGPKTAGNPPADFAPKAPVEDVSYYMLNGRLAHFRSIGEHREHWEGRWSRAQIDEWLTTGRLDDFEGLFTHYLPRDLPILEAGLRCANNRNA